MYSCATLSCFNYFLVSITFVFQLLSRFDYFRVSITFVFRLLSCLNYFRVSITFAFRLLSCFDYLRESITFAFQLLSYFDYLRESITFAFQLLSYFDYLRASIRSFSMLVLNVRRLNYKNLTFKCTAYRHNWQETVQLCRTSLLGLHTTVSVEQKHADRRLHSKGRHPVGVACFC